MYDVDVQLRQRNNTIKLISLVHNQFCSERFRGMICYSWYACGYCHEKPATFQTPVEFCFDQSSASSCDLCTTSQFITCGWCKAELCINHFLLQHHFCNNYVEQLKRQFKFLWRNKRVGKAWSFNSLCFVTQAISPKLTAPFPPKNQYTTINQGYCFR